MKMSSKILFMISGIFLSCNISQAMQHLTTDQISGAIDIIGAQMAHDLPEECDDYWQDPAQGIITSYKNSPTTMLNELWNNPLAQAEMRGVIIDAYCELTKFYAWAFNAANFDPLRNRIKNSALLFSESLLHQFKLTAHEFESITLRDFFELMLDNDEFFFKCLNKGQVRLAELYVDLLDVNNYVLYHNSFALTFCHFLEQMSTIISIAYGDKPDPDMEKAKKINKSKSSSEESSEEFLVDSFDEVENVLKDFVGTHNISGIVDNALIKLIALNKYLTIIGNKACNIGLQCEIKKAIKLINSVARSLNVYSDGNYIDRHLYREDSSEDKSNSDDQDMIEDKDIIKDQDEI